MKKEELYIKGISCMSCVHKIEKALYGEYNIQQITIDKNTGHTILEGEDIPDHTSLQTILTLAGDYTIGKAKKSILSTPYKPLILILIYLLAVTLSIEFYSGVFLMETWMGNFMAGFFLVFSFFKLLDLKSFANAYQSYDIIASKVKGYGYIYPFIEAGLGFAYLLFFDSPITNGLTALIMFVSTIGVVQSVINKSNIQCACLGTVFKLPMSHVTIIENGTMLLMALYMLL